VVLQVKVEIYREDCLLYECLQVSMVKKPVL